MKLSEFDYYLPESLIAQTPLKDRSSSKLLIMNRKTGELKDSQFKNIINYLNKNDVIVLNNTKVLPARLIGTKDITNAVIEILLLKEIDSNIWECLSKPVKRLKVGTIINFGDNSVLKCIVKEILNDGIIHVEFIYKGIFLELLEKLGTMPLPPYIHEKLNDQNRYQTVYASLIGSSAAPTAGLHFTKELLNKIQKKGVKVCYITLHVGLGTFRPVTVSNIENHHMHSEFYMIDKETANILNIAKKNNNKIIAVGTTTVRTLETILNNNKSFKECSGYTDIFIYPGYTFKAIDSLITNFHLPKSTLLMLVSAFSSKKNILNAYEHAVKNQYRFFSFGDAMFINKE